MSSAYGYEVKGSDGDPIVKVLEETVDTTQQALVPGRFLVNYFPVLRHIPSWAPGGNFHELVMRGKGAIRNMVELPFHYPKERMMRGTGVESFSSRQMSQAKETEDNIKWAAAMFFAAGSESTSITLHAFFRLMILYPEIQKRAQDELDRVVGNNQLPTLQDKEDLPYLNALITEVFRFHPALPYGLPHRAAQDNIFDDYFIPKDALIMANLWQMTHDPNVYEFPMRFNPSRFLDSEGNVPDQDPREIIFGFGRRICPGALFAEASIFLVCAWSLATLSITAPIENGVKIIPSLDVISGTSLHVAPFKCNIQPRSVKSKSLL